LPDTYRLQQFGGEMVGCGLNDLLHLAMSCKRINPMLKNAQVRAKMLKIEDYSEKNLFLNKWLF
jgi:hypothetical protein